MYSSTQVFVYAAVAQKQTAVMAYLKRKQLLLFVFIRQ